MSDNLTKMEWAKNVCNYTEKQCEFVVVAYEDGHKAGKVEGYNEAIEEIKKVAADKMLYVFMPILEALRKPEGDG